jgi:cell wall assembly regulator SMI1
MAKSVHPWPRLEKWLQAHAPKIYADLREPATDEDFEDAQDALSIQLPQDMVGAYRIHNGQTGMASPVAGDAQLLSLAGVASQWKIQKQLDDKGTFAKAKAKAIGPVRPTWWNNRWIPFAYNGSGDLTCVDLDPAEGGTVGQVVVYIHDREERRCIAKGLTDWLEQLVGDLESGKLKLKNA